MSLSCRRVALTLVVFAILAASVTVMAAVASQNALRANDRARGCSTPVSERRMEAGCYTTAESSLGPMPDGRWYWHIHAFASPEQATAARGARGTVVESLGRVWLYTVAEEGWTATGGDLVAVIGPLDVTAGEAYTARYMEAVFPPDWDSGVIGHRHPGSEAWFVLSGTQCLETPNGLIMASAGNAALVPEGWPMAISAVGPRTRRALVLVLHRSAERYSMPIHHQTQRGAPFAHWTPKGLCPQ